MAVITVDATKDASALKQSDGWSGWDDHHPVGTSPSGNTYFSMVYMPLSFTGWTGITNAKLWLRGHRAGSGNHVLGDASGNTRTLHVRRMTQDWGEGTDRGETLWSSAESWGWNNRRAAVTSTVLGSRIFSGYAEGTWYDIDVTTIVDQWFNGLAPNYGFGIVLEPPEEDQSDEALEFYSRHKGSGYKPYLEITYTTNVAPTAPTGLSPTADALVNTLSPTMTGTRADADSGDYITAYQILVYADDGTTLIWDSGTITQAGTGTVFSKVYAGPALAGNTFYKWKGRTRDRGAAWGPYSSLQRFKVNSPPNPPSLSLTESPTNNILTLTPHLNITHSDNDPSDTLMYGYHVILETAAGVAVWDSGDIDTSGSPVPTTMITYSGTTLSWQTGYRWRARTKDSNGVWGTYSGNATFTTHTTATPINATPSADEVISGLVPVFHAQRGSTADTISQWQIILRSGDNVTTIWDSGALTSGISSGTTIDYTYTGSALSYANRYLWQIRVFSTLGGWSAYQTSYFYTVGDATIPVQNLPTTNSGGLVTTLTPTFTGTRASAAFTHYQIEVYPATATSTTLGTPIWDSTDTTQSSGTSFSRVYSGPALTWAGTYKWRVRVGSPATLGAWTGLASFSTSSAGTPSLTLPADNAWITTLTPTFTGSSFGGENITFKRVAVYDATGVTLIWDSGYVTQSSATTFSLVYSGPTLIGGRNYQWQAAYTRSDGVQGPFSAKRIFRINGNPLIPNQLEPTPGFTFADTLLPTFKANFDDPDRISNGDYPTKWVIEVRVNSSDALVQTKNITSGLVSGLNTYHWTVGDTGLSLNIEYKWRTWFEDSLSGVGAASSYQVFSLGEAPVAEIISPSEGSNVNTTRPIVTWSYDDSNDSPQLKYRLRLYRVANGVKIWDSGEQISSATTSRVVTGFLSINEEDYRVELTVTSAAGLTSDPSSTTFHLALAAPPRIEGLSATVYEEESKIVLDWDQSSLAGNFVTYVIYRRNTSESEWTMIGTRKPETNTAFTDWYSGQRRDYEYRVTVVKLISAEPDLESPDSDIVTARLEADVWFVVGVDRSPEHIFELPVSDESHTRPVQQEEFEPIGSNRKAVVRGFVLGHEGSVDLAFLEDETYEARQRIEYLLFYAGPHILKTPFGDVYDVTFGSPDYQYQGGGSMNVTMTWIETGATNNPGLTPDQYLAQIGAE